MVEFIFLPIVVITLDFVLIQATVLVECTVGVLFLVNNTGSSCPFFGQVHAQGRSEPLGLDLVLVLFEPMRIVDGLRTVSWLQASVCASSGDIVYPAAILGSPAYQANRGAVSQRYIGKALDTVVVVAALYACIIYVESGLKSRGVGLVGDNTQGAGLRTGAIERALRARQGFDPLDIVDMDIQVGAYRGHRLLIQIHTYAWL